MNRLKNKHWLCALSFIVGIVFFSGCKPDSTGFVESSSSDYSFMEPVQVVDVDPTKKSFRIVLEYKGEGLGSPRVYIDTEKTTARHNEHFINHVEMPSETIGVFTPMDDDRQFYRDVELLPENITTEVSIFYNTGGRVRTRLGSADNVISRLEVILRPKID